MVLDFKVVLMLYDVIQIVQKNNQSGQSVSNEDPCKKEKKNIDV